MTPLPFRDPASPARRTRWHRRASRRVPGSGAADRPREPAQARSGERNPTLAAVSGASAPWASSCKSKRCPIRVRPDRAHRQILEPVPGDRVEGKVAFATDEEMTRPSATDADCRLRRVAAFPDFAAPSPGTHRQSPASLVPSGAKSGNKSRRPAFRPRSSLTSDIVRITVHHDSELQKQGAQAIHGARRRTAHPSRAP